MARGCLLLSLSPAAPATAIAGPRFVHCQAFGCKQGQEIRFGEYPGYAAPRQQDCIDESTNRLRDLVALEDPGMMQPPEQWRRMRDRPVAHDPELGAREV